MQNGTSAAGRNGARRPKTCPDGTSRCDGASPVRPASPDCHRSALDAPSGRWTDGYWLTAVGNVRRRCPVCGDVLGVYEPLIKIIDRVPYATSLAAESISDRDVVVHKSCAESVPAWQDEHSEADMGLARADPLTD